MNSSAFLALLGDSLAMQELRMLIRKAASSSIPVLIQGPTGVGKELVARALHEFSGRRGRYVPINIASLGDGTAESQLFGHVRGAFTGAHTDVPGVFAEADSGTVLLDEINSCPLHTQAKLLRVIEHGEIRAVGGRGERRYDFRVVAASNSDLSQLVQEGRFREDLLHRLSGIVLRIPPLKDRSEDIPTLVQYFAQEMSSQDQPIVQFKQDALDLLKAYQWPGNVRELKHSIQRMLVLCESPFIHAADVKNILEWSQADRVDNILNSERQQLLEILLEYRGDIEAAAAALSVNRSTLYRRLQRFGIRPSSIMLERRYLSNRI